MNWCLHSGVLVARNMSHRTHQTTGTTKLAELSPLCTWKISFRLRTPPNSKSQVHVWVFISNDGIARLSVTSSVSQTRVQAHTVATLKLVRQCNSGKDSEVCLSCQPCLPGSSLGPFSSSSTPRQALPKSTTVFSPPMVSYDATWTRRAEPTSDLWRAHRLVDQSTPNIQKSWFSINHVAWLVGHHSRSVRVSCPSSLVAWNQKQGIRTRWKNRLFASKETTDEVNL